MYIVEEFDKKGEEQSVHLLLKYNLSSDIHEDSIGKSEASETPQNKRQWGSRDRQRTSEVYVRCKGLSITYNENILF